MVHNVADQFPPFTSNPSSCKLTGSHSLIPNNFRTFVGKVGLRWRLNLCGLHCQVKLWSTNVTQRSIASPSSIYFMKCCIWFISDRMKDCIDPEARPQWITAFVLPHKPRDISLIRRFLILYLLPVKASDVVMRELFNTNEVMNNLPAFTNSEIKHFIIHSVLWNQSHNCHYHL